MKLSIKKFFTVLLVFLPYLVSTNTFTECSRDKYNSCYNNCVSTYYPNGNSYYNSATIAAATACMNDCYSKYTTPCLSGAKK